MPANDKKLDNPVWYSLTERHSRFSTGIPQFRKYDPDIVLFAGFDPDATGIFSRLDEIFPVNDSFFLFGQFPPLPANYTRIDFIECLQMTCPAAVMVPITEEIIQLDHHYTKEMYELVSTVFPGYYLPHTNRLGDYFGIFKNKKLVAMAGERLCMDGYSEVSAVVTHPGHTGKKYAQQLITHIHQKHMDEKVVSFLHTGAQNERAIHIYELLGYKKRRLIPVTKFTRIS
jgi:ribosomal protein S18 acetylase RimI-like enzyme